jgi:L-threonylcarbamoyladenylate synthase
MDDVTGNERRPIEIAAEHLRQGRLVAFPTETVYGLGGDALSDLAVARIYAAKGRPRFNPLIIHVGDVEGAARLVRFTPEARRLADLFWPGAITMVLPRQDSCRVSLLASAGLDTLAVRVPAHPLARTLLREFGRPLAAPSANLSGRVSPTEASHVAAELGDRVSYILDGGPCRIGLESTVVDLCGEIPRLLRPGGITREALEGVLGPLADGFAVEGDAARSSPGQLASHYAPGLPLRLEASERRPGEAYIAFGPVAPVIGPIEGQLSSDGDLIEAAARLFTTLRAVDRPPFTGIAVAPIPAVGIGAAINDRLRRGAAPREP